MLEALVLAISFYLPGHFLGGALSRKGDGLAEAIVLRLCCSVAVATPVLVALAVWGWFTVVAISGALLACAALAWLVSRGRRSGVRPGRWDLAPLSLAIASLVLYARPAEHVVNDRDPGVYSIAAAKLARSGELLTRDPLVRAVLPFHDFSNWAKYPGFYIYGDDLVVPQFFPGPFVWLGFGNLAGGLAAELYVVPLFGVLSVTALFLLGREFFRGWAALAGSALLAASFAQVWWARQPSSEVITQFFVVGGLWMAVRFLGSGGWRSGFAAGMLLGAAMLVRVDAFLALAAVPVLFGRDLLAWENVKRWLPFLAPLVAFALAALLYANTVGGRYLNLIYDRHGLKGLLESVPYVAGAMILLAAVWALLRRRGFSPGGWLLSCWHGAMKLAALAFLGFSIWAYFVRPGPLEQLSTEAVGFHAYDAQAAVRLVWVMTTVVTVLGLAGFLLAAFRLTDERLLLLGAVAGFGVVYVVLPNVTPDLPWATRRFVPAVLPGFALLAGYAIVSAGRLVPRPRAGVALSATLFVVALAFTVRVALPVYTTNELGGAVGEMDRLNAEIPPSEVVFVVSSGGFDHASTLDYLYGRPVLTYSPESFKKELGSLREAGLLEDAAYVNVNGERPPDYPGIEMEKVGKEIVSVQRLERTLKEMPDETYRQRTEFGVYTVEDRR
jgi:hypothetical protein